MNDKKNGDVSDSSENKTNNQKLITTDSTDGVAAGSSPKAIDVQARELEKVCRNKAQTVKEKFNKVTELLKSQIELKRLIKRNQKMQDGI